MSLHDISKGNPQRLNPTPNSNDQQKNRMAHNTAGFTYVTESSGDVAYMAIKEGRMQIYKADGTLFFQAGFRDADGDGAVDMAKPGSELT